MGSMTACTYLLLSGMDKAFTAVLLLVSYEVALASEITHFPALSSFFILHPLVGNVSWV